MHQSCVPKTNAWQCQPCVLRRRATEFETRIRAAQTAMARRNRGSIRARSNTEISFMQCGLRSRRFVSHVLFSVGLLIPIRAQVRLMFRK